MSFLKSISIQYTGELHQVRLVNFWVDYDEVAPFVPKPLKVRNFGGKALISSVNVDLKKMHANMLPAVEFGYRHVAFRLALDDAHLNNGASKGIFFLQSFTDRADVAAVGNLFTNYKLETAEMRCLDRMLELHQGEKYFNYALDLSAAPSTDAEQYKILTALDRAYAVEDEVVKMVRIQREKW